MKTIDAFFAKVDAFLSEIEAKDAAAHSTYEIDVETKVRKVKDSAYWGRPVGTPITPGMKPEGPKSPIGRARAAAQAAGGGKGRGGASSAKPKKRIKPAGAKPSKPAGSERSKPTGSTRSKPAGSTKPKKPVRGDASSARGYRRADTIVRDWADEYNGLGNDPDASLAKAKEFDKAFIDIDNSNPGTAKHERGLDKLQEIVDNPDKHPASIVKASTNLLKRYGRSTPASAKPKKRVSSKPSKKRPTEAPDKYIGSDVSYSGAAALSGDKLTALMRTNGKLVSARKLNNGLYKVRVDNPNYGMTEFNVREEDWKKFGKVKVDGVDKPNLDGPNTKVVDAKDFSVSGAAKELKKINKEGRKDGNGSEADPIDVGDDIELAHKLLSEGKHIRMKDERAVSSLLDKLHETVKDAREKGDKAPEYDLCKVSVPKTNLFCVESKGVPRVKMPQFKGTPVEGSFADTRKNDKGEGDVEPEFRELLAELGIGTEMSTVKASELRASQDNLDGPKVVGMAQAMREGKIPDAPIFVTRDGYILDGHHRWAAKVAIDLDDGVSGDIEMPVEIIDAEIGYLIDLANGFTEIAGIKPKGLGAAAEGVKALPLNPDGTLCLPCMANWK